MEIKDERKGTDAIFADLTIGEIFDSDGDFFMKIEEVEEGCGYFNAIFLKNGNLGFFEPSDKVTPLVVQLRIIRND